MESWIIWTIVGCLGAAFALMVFVQYQYIDELRQKKHTSGKDQNTYYEKMSFEEEQLHYNQQGAFWPAAAVAALIHRVVRLFRKNSTAA